jgi:hypothetical protein
VSTIRGIQVPYDADWINEKIGGGVISPISAYERSEGVVDDFTRMRNQGDLDLQTTLERICYEDRRIVEMTRNGVPHKVLWGNMTVISKLWMTFILANLRPKSHPSDLSLEECHLLGCIKTPGITVDPARIISDMIWANVHKGGTKQSLAFPSLITSLCEDAGVPVVRS